MTKVSFVIPVYNGEKEISIILQSILSQSYQNWEVIFINDGSTDKTMHILQLWQEKDLRIQVINTPNQGQGLARNIGLTHAVGDYIWFVDVDDFILPEALNFMVSIAERTGFDIICASYIRNTNEKHMLIKWKISEGLINKEGNKEERIRYHKFKTESGFGYVWNKIYRISFLREHQLCFDDIRKIYMEDLLFNLKVMTYNPTFYLINTPVYCYKIHANSTTQTLDLNIAIKNTQLINLYYSWLHECNKVNEYYDTLVALAARVISWSLFRNTKHFDISSTLMIEQIKHFMNSETILEIVDNKNNLRCLDSLSSKLQVIWYKTLFLLLRKRQYNLIAMLYVKLLPLFRLYINLVVK